MTQPPSDPDFSDRASEVAGDLSGDLHFDDLHRRLYAQDASIYEHQPSGVAYPKTAEDLQQLVEFADRVGLELTPRGGGTSLAGQCVGEGLIVDVGRHMNDILEVNTDEQWARVQPGVVLDDLNRHLEEIGLMFGPDTSTSDQCQIGGMIGNNSCGSHSVFFGTTRDHVMELELVLSDGTRVRVGDEGSWERHREADHRLGDALRTLEDELDEHGDLIREEYPKEEIVRRNTGYALDELLDADSRALPPLICGSEGTLAFVTEATLNLEERPGANLLVCAHFESLEDALNATVAAVAHEPGAVELMDRRILELTEDHPEQKKNRFFVEGEPGAILVIEMYGENEEDCEEQAREVIDDLKDRDLGFAFPLVYPPRDSQVWKLRKAGLGILMGIKGDTKPVTVVEDTAVALDDLPDYIDDFAGIMASYDTQCVYYAHASVGELHLRPELNLKEVEDAEKFEGIARDVTNLVGDYGGSLSGEHGDGRLRSPMLEQFYGAEIVDIFRRVKGAFDPDGIMNPDKIVDPNPIDQNWRVTPGQEEREFDTYLDWSDDGGLLRSVEKCNGAGVCRKHAEAGGTMCPSYMATLDEKDTTRGRANVFRQVLYEADPRGSFADDELRETLDLCLSCKGCKNECPANVDMARMKAEFTQHDYDENGVPRSAEIFGNYRRYAKLAAIWPWLANFLASFMLTRWLMDAYLGTAPERSLPEFAGRQFTTWFDRRDGLAADEADATVWLFVDPFTEFNEPEIGKSAVRVLEAAGYRVEMLPIDDDGRTHLSKGLVERAKAITAENLETLAPLFDEHPDRAIVGLEPSALLTFRDETPDLAESAHTSVAEELGERAYLFEEFVEQASLDGEFAAGWSTESVGEVRLHGHCHQKAIVGTKPTEAALQIAGYTVETIDSGCCGMAGSFGYEADHYDVSMQIGEQRLFPAVRETGDEAWIAAPGTSCRHQIKDGTEREALHPAQLLEKALADGA